MRRLLTFLIFFVAVAALVAVVLVPLLVNPLVGGLVRNALPFGDQPLDVRVDAGLPLLTGHVNRIEVSGRGLTTGGVTLGVVDVGVSGFSIIDRSFASADGGVEKALVPLDDGTSALVDRIDLSGGSSALRATARLSATETERVVRSSLGQAGVVPDSVTLGSGVIQLSVSGFTVAARLEARDGALVLVGSDPLPPLEIVRPGPADAWRISGVSVGASGMTITADVDADALLRGG